MANLMNRITSPENTFEHIIQEISQLGTAFIDLDQYCELVLKRVSERYGVYSAGLFLKQKAANRYHLSARKNLAIGDMQFGLEHPLPFYLKKNPRLMYASDIEILPQFEALWTKEREELKSSECLSLFTAYCRKRSGRNPGFGAKSERISL